MTGVPTLNWSWAFRLLDATFSFKRTPWAALVSQGGYRGPFEEHKDALTRALGQALEP